MMERGPAEGDGWPGGDESQPVFDEAFLAGARYWEPSAAERGVAAERKRAEERQKAEEADRVKQAKRARKAERVQRSYRFRQVLGVVLAVVLLGILFFGHSLGL